MLGQRHERSEDQPLSVDASLRSFLLQIVLRRPVWCEQPQYTAVDLLEEPHPDREHRWRDLIAVVERAEDKALLRQANLGAGERFLARKPVAIGRHEAVRQ